MKRISNWWALRTSTETKVSRWLIEDKELLIEYINQHKIYIHSLESIEPLKKDLKLFKRIDSSKNLDKQVRKAYKDHLIMGFDGIETN